MTTVNNAKLIDFVKHLYEMHEDFYGFDINVRRTGEGADRCKRWMDAVLPEVMGTMDIPDDQLAAMLRDKVSAK
jgi:hypothetical protein